MANIIYICAFFGITAAAFGCLMVCSKHFVPNLLHRAHLESSKLMLKMVSSLKYSPRLTLGLTFQLKAPGSSVQQFALFVSY